MDLDKALGYEQKCIQEQLPVCNCECPVHVDVRAMIAEISRGDFAAALRVFIKTVPFPGIISHICDQPCQKVCKREEIGGAINISALERACVQFAPVLSEKLVLFPQKNKRVAVIGGGLSGLTAAFDLAKKGYKVVIYEKQNRLGGSIWNYPPHLLLAEIIQSETSIVKKAKVDVRLNTALGDSFSLDDLLNEFDAVYLGTGKDSVTGLPNQKENQPVLVDPVTFTTEREGVFAGGSLVRDTANLSPIGSVADGRRAAISIDRFIKKVSLTSGRELEGSYKTSLFTSIEGIKEASPIVLRDGMYNQEEAIQEAQRCLQCQCLECVKVCQFLKHYDGYPKKYIRQISKNIMIQPGFGLRSATKIMNSCSLCGLCAKVCPERVDMAEVCLAGRQAMVSKKYMPPAIHDFPIRDMLFSNSVLFSLARHQPGMDSSKYAFFPGCQLSASYPEYIKKTYGYLQEKLIGGVGLVLQCCGAPANWAGRQKPFAEVCGEFKQIWQQMGCPELILACSACYQTFKSHLPEIPIKSIWEVFNEKGLPDDVPQNTASEKRVAVHDPCTSRNEPQIQEIVRKILTEKGYEITELPLNREKTKCCGFGGLMSFANPDLAGQVIEQRIKESPLDYVAYCAICRDYFASQGKATWHLLDLVYGADHKEQALKRGPGYSQRRENRIRLKKELLKELWKESLEEKEDFRKIKLNIPPQIEELMEKRLILREDIQRVIEYAEKTGNKIKDPKRGCFIAYYRPEIITYWVEYTCTGDEFTIHNAYSHRMQINEE